MAGEMGSEALARRTFYITLVFCLAFAASVFVFIL
jgi:hypothetical protein